MRADIHDGPEHMLQSEAGYIDARPLTPARQNLLQRTAGPYIGSEPDLCGRGYSARLKTASSVTSFTNGLLNFNSLSVSEVMLRFSEGLPVRFAKVLA